MRGATIHRVERGVEAAAAGIFAAAVAYSAGRLLELTPLAWPLALAAAFLLCRHALAAVGAEGRDFVLAAFDVPSIEPQAPEELLLTEADEVEASAPHTDELLLDDVLAAVGPDSRVVRLFDRRGMLSPGELSERIDRHLERAALSPAPDASQALYDALAGLRVELR
jgi:hypothetical protein